MELVFYLEMQTLVQMLQAIQVLVLAPGRMVLFIIMIIIGVRARHKAIAPVRTQELGPHKVPGSFLRHG